MNDICIPQACCQRIFSHPVHIQMCPFYLPPNIEILISSTSYAWDHHPPLTTCPTQQLSTTSLCKLKVNKDEMGVPKICGYSQLRWNPGLLKMVFPYSSLWFPSNQVIVITRSKSSTSMTMTLCWDVVFFRLDLLINCWNIHQLESSWLSSTPPPPSSSHHPSIWSRPPSRLSFPVEIQEKREKELCT